MKSTIDQLWESIVEKAEDATFYKNTEGISYLEAHDKSGFLVNCKAKDLKKIIGSPKPKHEDFGIKWIGGLKK